MKTYFFIALVIVMSSCANRLPFSQKVRENHNLTQAELSRMQFYVSSDIILTKKDRVSSSQDIEGGTLTLKNERESDLVVIKAGTPGVLEKVIDDKRIAVSFEPGKFLVFGDPDLKNGRYTLLAADWENNRGVLNYGGEKYYANHGASNIYIQFKMKRLNQIKRKVRYAPGMKVPK